MRNPPFRMLLERCRVLWQFRCRPKLFQRLQIAFRRGVTFNANAPNDTVEPRIHFVAYVLARLTRIHEGCGNFLGTHIFYGAEQRSRIAHYFSKLLLQIVRFHFSPPGFPPGVSPSAGDSKRNIFFLRFVISLAETPSSVA